ncbi:FtsK/SpoIIIE family DNA translocase [Lentilactobacillus buchneri]|uniref:DNA translocase FtsK n=1 Tax=Lentilactobacillus buchneri subsp. silagei CD034 TaxID=1071400 RepID=J9W017_LENBU|nr:DNA translocase FtsK [Lentilactobacillus buchneri]MCC6101889.1 DNA translocase FtsK [Lactobacillus sp.]AFR99798.1 FtsK/SpoIIIE family DNA translocase [Lentilactobacillus buchneri subsp. silagei CD034]MCT2901703.1 DNA translocase FtsK [Lentilactobacillus buchneri]MCT3543318.1 DNA translocase FtsK [Lentilactobacillus buchneri]MCT3544060.1 DNA translocase FtsK [Lentilactobacillus buchneri]
MKTKRTKRTKQTSSKPVKKRGRPRKTTKKTGGQSSFLQKYTVNVIGGVVAILALLGLFQAGIVGTLMINIAKLFVGSLYPVFLLVGIVVGVFLAGFSRFPKIPAKYTWGTALILLGVLLWLTLIEYIQAAQPVDFINFNWQKLVDDVVSSNSDSNIGGGILATIVFYLAHVLFGKIGTGIVASLIILIGGFILFDISFAKIFMGLRTCLTFIKTRAAAIRQQTDQKRSKKPAKQPSSATAANHPQTVEQPQNDDSEPNKLSASAITISGMPVTDEAKQSRKPVSKPTPPKESEKADDSADVNLVDVKEDDAYKLPTTDLLTQIPQDDQSSELQSIDHNAQVLQKTLDSFGVKAEIKHVSLGPSVTKYELHPDIGVKVSRIVNLADDIALALAAKDIRIEAPIPGKSLIGIEVPNRKIATVSFRDVVEHQPDNHGHVLQVPLGKDVNGNVITADLTKMPHLLIAGSTGSGKSVAINGIITSILLHAKPSQVKLMLIDPKKVELGVYNGIPHLLSPVVSEPKKAARALQKVVSEMENRYELFAKFGQRKISTYNDFVAKNNRENDTKIQPMPYIVVIVDELADLMMTVSNDVEAAIIRLAQMGRAAGIHMILATQRPSVDVITGLIKANVPSRIAFAVSSGIDSRTIIDTNGAEKLLGRGDMLFLPIDSNTPIRVQGAFIPDKDVSRVVKFITDQQSADYDESMMVSDEEIKEEDQEDSEDDLFNDALAFVVDQQKASTSLLQRHFRIGYNRAARLIDDLEKRGYIGPQDGSRPRQVYKEKQE